jgi:ribosomal protein S18 acetylase RimI-like enzyme
MITYLTSANDILPGQLTGFFEGWPNPPSADTHLRILHNSSHIVIALDNETDQVVGFITAISDRTLSAYIPFPEVLPEYRRQEIATELVRQMFFQLDDYYMVDLVCDEHLRPFYEKLGLHSAVGMLKRNYSRQSGV